MKRKYRLTKRDDLILRHIASHQMSTFEAIRHLFFENQRPDAAKSTLRRLGNKGMGLIASENITGTQKVYYRLTPKGGKLLNVPSDRCKRLGDSKLPQCYAMLWFTCFSEPSIERTICKPRDYPSVFSFGNQRIPKIDFYIANNKSEAATGSGISFGFAMTDFDSRPRRIVDRARVQLSRMLDRKWFDQLILAKRFELAVLTGTKEKQRTIEMVLRSELLRTLRGPLLRVMGESCDRFPIKTHVAVIPGLNDLIPGQRKLRKG